MQELAEILLKNNISISSVESFTVGYFANTVGSIPGISKVYKGSLVSYATEIKRDVLSIDQSIIDNYGVVSNEVALLMAKRGQNMFGSQVCISFTGNAGPSVMEDKPVGLIFIGIVFADRQYTYEYHFSGSREEIKQQAVNKGIELLKEVITD